MTQHLSRRSRGAIGARAAALALAALLFAALAGCSLTRSPPVKETYLLEPAMPPAVARTHPHFFASKFASFCFNTPIALCHTYLRFRTMRF